MEIGIDEEFEDVLEDSSLDTVKDQQDTTVEDTISDQEDFITTLLKSRGIEDKSKIKFEDEEGSIVEHNWDELTNDERLNILNSSKQDPDTDLDDAETQLINTIRQSGLSPSEYLEYLQKESIDNYIQNSKEQAFEIDQYSDDELFVFDLISRAPDITDEEAQDALERAKSNEALYTKQIAALRNEYKAIEEENRKQAQFEQEESEKEKFNQFADQIADQISDFNEFSGYDLNLNDEDRDELYDFITGVDSAGNNYFAKALSDPKVLVQTAWLALNGQQMMEDVTNYFKNEIKSVRKESYEKGLKDAGKKQSPVVFKERQKVDTDFDDLDNF